MEAHTGLRNNFDSIMQSLEIENMAQRDRGTLFEAVVTGYLKNEPMYARLFDEVWMLRDVPEKYQIPKKDTGVDLVARNRDTGDLVAIQCKYYSKGTTIQKSHIDSFLNEVGKSYYTGGIIVSSTDKWSNNAEQALLNRDKIITRIGLSQLRDSEIDWTIFSLKEPSNIQLKSPKEPRFHQIPAIEAVIEGFKKADRGKLIMAPGTGKTYTSMIIAEKMAEKKEGAFKVLYLVPSIQLLSQSLRGWTADSKYRQNMNTFAVCSDRKVTKQKGGNELEDISSADLGYPATTDYTKLLEHQREIDAQESPSKFLVVFSTYQSIDVIIDAQRNGFYEFDLVICDEAHRTTGITGPGNEESPFVKVHYDYNIKTAKRLYQTATPRVYGDDARSKADEMSVVVADMNDTSIYGEEFYRIGFGQAVSAGILTDYRVMVLAVDEGAIAKQFQDMLADEKTSELKFNDVTKIVGCWNGLVKRRSNSNIISDKPMKRAIAFTGTIKESKLMKDMFKMVVQQYLYKSGDFSNPMNIEIDHADGSMNAMEKNEKIAWLKSDVPANTCRILSNARFLTEGVDVPDLDAVMFLKPRKSKIDIAQAVGRVMRKSEGKQYGYVILPIGVPVGVEPENILNQNENYKVVWEVLNALRSLDERFDSMINKIELNKRKPPQLSVIGVGEAPSDEEGGFEIRKGNDEQLSLNMDGDNISDLERALYGKIVKKVGNVRYWEQWSSDVADIARQHMMRIGIMLEDKEGEAYRSFSQFLMGLRQNINNSISEEQAIEMLAQHLITKPVFEALFDSYSFVNNNPVSQSMDAVLTVMDEKGLVKEQERLEKFYESVRVRAEGIDNLKAKQDIIIQLYDKFFKVGFKETTERLGIVFTPVEVVDFIIRSVEDVLKKHFGKSISDEGVHILDPFTGTGTFIVRLLQSGLIKKEDLLRKYMQELHANEMVLLSYYIAAINIEETFHSLSEGDYIPFEGIVLTDTFESTERENLFESELFSENNVRLKRQQQESIFAIIGNPPYSKGQKNENDKNKNESYPTLDNHIANSYVKHSKTNSVLGMYDSYVRAIRWSTDRLNGKGVLGFVSNGSFIDSISSDGLRKSLFDEFNHLYVFNLRGDQRTVGEKSRQEGGKIFGSGSRTPIAIYLFVKDGSTEHNLYYHDIGDYLSREEKLSVISEFKSIEGIQWTKIIPDENNDWINQRDISYDLYTPISDENNSVFELRDLGVVTNRDAWVTGFGRDRLESNVNRLIDNYNNQVMNRSLIQERIDLNNVDDYIDSNPEFISWSRSLKQKYISEVTAQFDESSILVGLYRPFTKKYYYRNRFLNENVRKSYISFPNLNVDNLLLNISGQGAKGGFSALVSDCVTFMDALNKSRNFPLKLYSENAPLQGVEYNISDSYANQLGVLNKEDAFYYVYAVLHHPEYRLKFANDLSKVLPRIPILKNKEEFIYWGKKLAYLHINYETIPPYDDLEIEYKSKNPSYCVQKMKHPNRGKMDTIIFNKDITIKNIPEKAYEYMINGRSAIGWIMDQYQVKIDKKSGITDDPNLYSEDEKYIFNLLLSIVNISVQTVDLVNSLPPLEIEE